MKLKLLFDKTHPPGTPEAAETLSMVMQALRRASDGEFAIPTVEGVYVGPNPPENLAGMVVLFWWTAHPSGLRPVVVFVDTPERRFVYWEVPETFSTLWQQRFVKAAERLDRQMNRGEQGKRLKDFRLGTADEVSDFLQGSLRAYQESTH